jgi:hypothetical protein
MDDPPNQLTLFGAKAELHPVDRDLAGIGVNRREITHWHAEGFLSFDPNRVSALERWMLDEVVFIRDLRKVEWSLNALRQLLAPLKRPYALSHGEHFFNFRELRWERRYRFYEIKTAILENPEAAAEGACGLIRGVADFGTREQLLKILAELQRVLSRPGGSDDAPRPPLD